MSEKKPLNYIASLDGVRGLFCLGILSHHIPIDYLRTHFAYFWFILPLFFVMSGFLITRILINQKNKGESFGGFFGNFYIKRSFRIFPLYFTYVFFWFAVVYFFGDKKAVSQGLGLTPEIQNNWWMLLSYTYNIKESINQFLGKPAMYGCLLLEHLWSLSLEEQFYFIIPFLVFFLSEKNLKRVILLIVIAMPIVRYFGMDYLSHCDYVKNIDIAFRERWLAIVVNRSSFFQFDALFTGALMATFDFGKIKKAYLWFYGLCALWLILTTLNGYYIAQQEDTSMYQALHEIEFLAKNYVYVYIFTIVNFMCLFFLLTLMRKETGMNKIFENRFLVYLGKISYGIYVFHFAVFIFTFGFSVALCKVLGWNMQNLGVGIIVWIMCYAMTLLVSHLSYKYFEHFFLRIKDKLYSKP